MALRNKLESQEAAPGRRAAGVPDGTVCGIRYTTLRPSPPA
jgi:hypothetical protein